MNESLCWFIVGIDVVALVGWSVTLLMLRNALRKLRAGGRVQ